MLYVQLWAYLEKLSSGAPDLFREFIVYCPVLCEYNSPVNFIATLDSQKSERILP